MTFGKDMTTSFDICTYLNPLQRLHQEVLEVLVSDLVLEANSLWSCIFLLLFLSAEAMRKRVLLVNVLCTVSTMCGRYDWSEAARMASNSAGMGTVKTVSLQELGLNLSCSQTA